MSVFKKAFIIALLDKHGPMDTSDIYWQIDDDDASVPRARVERWLAELAASGYVKSHFDAANNENVWRLA